jgi:ABC-type transport system involved in multi-copper enzyme maturation permease subunit
MMLWYKAWRESRVRFLLTIAVWAFLCLGLMYRARTGFPPAERPDLPYSAWVWGNIYGNMNPTVFIILVMILGLGGLQRERPAGTSAFTLALPVTRWRLLTVRAAVGLIQVAILSFLPAMLIPTLSPLLAAQHYSEAQALQFGLLFVTWGAVAFAVGFLWSSMFGGEFTGTALCVITPVVYRILLMTSSSLQSYPALNYATFMSGIPYIQSPIKVVIDKPLPWFSLFVLSTVTAGLIACAARITSEQDF